jgi:hypothetical protein
MYIPAWTLDELLNAGSILGPKVEIKQRFRQVGGVPRHIFATDRLYIQALDSQRNALNNLTAKGNGRHECSGVFQF